MRLSKKALEEWKEFRAEMLEKWLNPFRFEKGIYEEADKKYEEFRAQKKLEWQERKKAGFKVNPWEEKEDPMRLGGFRGQKWFSEMLWNLSVIPHYSELKAPSFLTLPQWKELKQRIEECGFKPKEESQKWLAMKYCK